jgi:dTDP-L-rhamnose 4-epimerase
MRVLVTGGAGFIGSAIVDLLVAGGHEAVVLDRRAGHVPPDAEALVGDLRDPACADVALRGVDAVCHQAAMVGLGVDFDDVEDFVDHNARATAVLLRAMHRVRFTGRLVLASSMVVYGEGAYRCADHGTVRPAPRTADLLDAGRFEPGCPRCGGALVPEAVDEHAALEPRNVYAATKLLQEHLCASFAREHGTPHIALRYHNVYGPRMPRDTPYAGVAAIFLDAIRRGEAPMVFEDGGQLRDFVHVADVARANVAALLAPPHVAGAFNVASGRRCSVLELATTMCEAYAAPLPPRVVGGYRLGDVRHVFASPERLRSELGVEASVPLDAGVRTLSG